MDTLNTNQMNAIVEFPQADPVLRSLYKMVLAFGKVFNGGTCDSLQAAEYEAEVVFNEPFGNHLTVVTEDRSVYVQWAFNSVGHSYVSSSRLRSRAKARRYAEEALACMLAEKVDWRSEGF